MVKNEEQLLVTIVIPLYNRAELIRDTIFSIERQTYSHWEAIVVDDGSTDDSYTAVEAIAHANPKIKVFRRDREPKGAPTCRNIGIKKAVGDFIIFLDSDDLLAPFCLQQRVEYMQGNPDLGYAVFMGQLFHDKPGDNQKLINIPTEEDDLVRFLKQDTPWLISNPIWRRSVLKSLQWDEQLTCFQDYLFHIQAILKKIPYKKVVTQPDCFWRRGTYIAVSNSNLNKKGVESVKRIIDFVGDWVKRENCLQIFKLHLQRAYIDVINRALTAKQPELAIKMLDGDIKELFRPSQQKLLLMYIKLYPAPEKVLQKRLIKKAFRSLLGSDIFQMQYGTFIRVEYKSFFEKKSPINA